MLVSLAGGLPLPAGASPGKHQSKKEAYESQLLIFGTVFTQEGFAFPGARIRVRRATEHKPRWEALSDRRGEFAIRVPKGGEYEVVVTAKGFAEITRPVDGRTGSRVDLVFRLEPRSGAKR